MANEELEFANDPLGAVASTGTSPAWRVVLTIGCAVGAAIMWADWAEVEQGYLRPRQGNTVEPNSGGGKSRARNCCGNSDP